MSLQKQMEKRVRMKQKKTWEVRYFSNMMKTLNLQIEEHKKSPSRKKKKKEK